MTKLRSPRLKILFVSFFLLLIIPIAAVSSPMWKSDKDFVPLNVPLDIEIQEFTYYLCDEYGVDFYLVMALIKTESSFRAEVVSKTNDYGLMQINKCNHGWLSENLGLTDFLDPYQSIRAGVYIMSDLYAKYETTAHVLMAYNLGEAGANALWRGGVYETKYVRAIMKNLDDLK